MPREQPAQCGIDAAPDEPPSPSIEPDAPTLHDAEPPRTLVAQEGRAIAEGDFPATSRVPGSEERALAAPSLSSGANPRTALLTNLTAGLLDSIQAGDLEAARIAHDAIGRLLGLDQADARTPVVLDLASEHARRRPRR